MTLHQLYHIFWNSPHYLSHIVLVVFAFVASELLCCNIRQKPLVAQTKQKNKANTKVNLGSILWCFKSHLEASHGLISQEGG